METIIIKGARWKTLLFLFISLAFVGTGTLIIATGKNALVGWASVLFFGAGGLVFVWQLVDARPRLIINNQGIMDRTLGVGVIPWKEIRDAYKRSINGNDFICLELYNPEPYWQKLSAVKRAMSSANRTLRFTDFSLNLSLAAVNADEVLELILKKCMEHQLNAGGRFERPPQITAL